MPTSRALLGFLVLLLVLLPAGCGKKSGSDDKGSGKIPAVSGAPGKKPQIAKPDGDPPMSLVVKDLVQGKGKQAADGARISVQYVGVSWSTGDEFDASWNRGQPFEFVLGSGQVIPGWDKGVKGMRVGGRRELVIPSDLGYGAQGQPPSIAPNETLVFVIDLEKIAR